MSKKNFKWLVGTISDVNNDLMVEANFLNDNWDVNNKYMEKSANENKDTIAFWHKDTKVAFREFKSDKVKIERAYAKYIESEKVKKERKGKK